MKRLTKEQLRKYCANRPPSKPNPNSEPHTVMSITEYERIKFEERCLHQQKENNQP